MYIFTKLQKSLLEQRVGKKKMKFKEAHHWTWSQESKNKIKGKGNHRYGKPPWNKDLTKETDPRVATYTEKISGIPVPEDRKKKISKTLKKYYKDKRSPFYRKHHTEEARKKISERQRGCKNNNFGRPRSKETRKKISEANKGKEQSEESRRKISEAGKGRKASEETKRKMSKAHKELWQDPSYIKKVTEAREKALHRKPNRPEQLFINFCNKYNLPYRYTGDGEVIIGSKNPDFINNNGKKEVVEIFGDFWHSKKVQGISKEEHIEEYIDYYAKYGFNCTIIWEHEVKDENIIKERLGL